MAGSRKRLDVQPSGFFTMRTPLLPFEEVESWSSGLAAPAAEDDPERLAEALAADRTLLRERLRRLIERPEIREALFVAAPELVSGIRAWHRDPESKKGRRAEETLVRYFLRMAARPTPFGLFSGCSTGTVSTRSELRLPARDAYERHTRLDMDYLFALTEDLGRDPELRRLVRYYPNSSLYRAAGRWRYAEARLQGKRRSHHLVAVESSEYVDETLQRARAGITMVELAGALVDADPDGDVTMEEATEFVEELIDTQLLVSELSPAVTGREPIHDLLDQLGVTAEHGLVAAVAAGLAEVRDALAELDADGLGSDPERYRAVAGRLEALPTKVELPRLFQVDMIKPTTSATLGPEVVAEIERGIEILHRLSGSPREDALSRFRQDFIARYGEAQTVPLVEALDEEVGVGFGTRGSEASPLLAGLNIPSPPSEATVPWGEQGQWLLRKLEQALTSGAHAIELGRRDLKALDSGTQRPLPDAFQVMATIVAGSPEALAQGEFRVHLKNVFGPSGARLLGRFCHADPALQEGVEGHLREEEALEPDAIFAEVVHLPEGRIGNILARPVMRPYEIPFLGRGGADHEHRIPVTDLLVSVMRDEIVLCSARLERRILPRLTSAHNYSNRGLGIYRFLCQLQSQGVGEGMGWNWGPFQSAAFRPRVTSGRLVLSRARWLVDAEQIKKLTVAEPGKRFRAVRQWRERRGLPRLVVLVDADNELLVDLDNILSIDTFIAVIKNRSQLVLAELFPGPDELYARGPEGRFLHQLLIPFVRRREVSERPQPALVRPLGRRTFEPGSEWLYVKVFTGTATADRVLAEVLRPVVRQVMDFGAVDRWFFIRYGDPRWHLRLRFHGAPQPLQAEVLPLVEAALSPLIDGGLIWDLQIDTYKRELERYGGAEGIELAEQLFFVDSEAVLALVESLEGDEGAEARWRLALRGSDLLLSDLGFPGEAKLEIAQRMQSSFAGEFRIGRGLKSQLADRLRRQRRELEALLEPTWVEDHPLAPGFEILERRSRELAPITTELRDRERAGRLTVPLADLATSYVHMFNNRLLRSEGRAHELVLYDFLYRLMQSKAARRRQSSTH
ncbi:MAG: lantibiotic dehydratase [bacterium]|nr:lantibiotic dehydratase [bacterium]